MTPSLSLNFTNGMLSPLVTFSRALDTATRINSSGLVEAVNADVPRFDFDPVSLACRGLLIEDQRENKLLYSSDISDAVWTKTSATIDATLYSAPDGTTSAQKITFGASTSALFTQSFSAVLGSAAHSFWIRSDTSTTVRARFVNNGSASATTVVNVTTSWQRVAINRTGTGTGITLVGLQNNASANAEPIYVWGHQFEAGAGATSYIPTTTTSLTRNADVATITGANFSNWWQATRGGVLVRALPGTVSGVRPWLQFDDGTANEIIALRGNTTNPELYIVDGGTPQAQIDAGTIAANTDYSLTGWWATNDCKARLDSGAVVTDTTATIPTVTQARLGSDGTNYLNGHLASISYYDSFSEQIYTRRKNKAVFNLM